MYTPIGGTPTAYARNGRSLLRWIECEIESYDNNFCRVNRGGKRATVSRLTEGNYANFDCIRLDGLRDLGIGWTMRVDRVTLRLPQSYKRAGDAESFIPQNIKDMEKKLAELELAYSYPGGTDHDAKLKEINVLKNKLISALEKELAYLKLTYDYPGTTNKAVYLQRINIIKDKLAKAKGAEKQSENYQYISSTQTVSTGKGVSLHIIKTHANNITFKSREGQSGIPETEYGINGGYFTLKDSNGTSSRGTLNICVKDDVYLFPNQEHNNGMLNCYSKDLEGSGTIIFTGSKMQCRIVRDYRSEIANYQYGKDKVNCKWAQGGVSMSLGNSNWEMIATNEKLVGGTTYRTGMVADSNCNIYLIVTDTQSSPAEFRDAIQKYFGIQDGVNTSYMGIFLDASTCSQLRCKEKSVARQRDLLPLIVLINK